MRVALGKFRDLVHDLFSGLLDHFTSADGAVRNARARKQQTHVIIDFGDSAHRRARIVTGGFLVNGNGGGEPVDVVHIGLVHLTDELARIRRKRFNVTPLSFSKDRIECQRRFTRTR